jgi:hypothetical protein
VLRLAVCQGKDLLAEGRRGAFATSRFPIVIRRRPRCRAGAATSMACSAFSSTNLSVSVTTSVLRFIAQGLAFVSLPFYLQDVIGVSALATGLLTTPESEVYDRSFNARGSSFPGPISTRQPVMAWRRGGLMIPVSGSCAEIRPPRTHPPWGIGP